MPKPRTIVKRRRPATVAAPPGAPAVAPLVLRIAEVRQVLRIGDTTIFKLIKERKLRSSKIGTVRVIHMDSVHELLIAGRQE